MESITSSRRHSLLPNFGGKNGSMKRHSLANITEAWKGYSLGRRGSFGACRMSVANALDCASRHQFLESIQVAVIQLFQKKKLQEFELASLQESVRNLVDTEAGPLIFDYFKDKLLKKGMVILRECMKNDLGTVLLKKMSDQWNYLYTQIIPTLLAMLYALDTKETSLRKVILLEFRDIVVLKVGLDDSLSTVSKEDIPSSIKQMLLVLQGYHDGFPPSDKYAKLERMVARVVSPHLGFFGLYEGSHIPTVRCSIKPSSSPKPKEKTEAYELDVASVKSKLRQSNILPVRNLHKHHANGHIFNHFLEPVVEQESVRRHSIDM
ncbi:hypothetical protein FSP39_024273 [Pinctada imbricata]|uniref:Uncharacterized protein n=1 Tax=Pinctada imbricata TaxID=66713 RepID=A0AA88YCU6_PINIB|nr:hypothetical protein FSP39_024273 [Pinctada imbricata]